MILIDLFLTFFKIGLFTFGGGYAMLPLIQTEVEANGWMESARLLDFIAVSESTPGPFAINIATFVGSEMGGVYGSFFATLGVVLPSFIIILIVAHFYEQFKNSKIVSGLMSGLKPAAIGLIAAALVSLAVTVFLPSGFTMSVFTDVKTYISLAIFAISILLALKKLHPIFIILIAAAIGIATGYLL